MRTKWSLGLVVLCFFGCDGPPSGDADAGPGDAGTSEPNPFFPQDLADSVEALSGALGEQPLAGDVRLALVANRISSFWTPAQIGIATASQRIGCVSRFDATLNGTAEEQIAIVDELVEQGYSGVAVSVIEPTALEPALAEAVSEDTHVITFDSDAVPGSVRTLYLGTVNYQAGRAAGEAMIEALGPEGGEVVAFVGFSTSANAIERIQGIEDVFEGTNVSLVETYYDAVDFAVARSNVETAIVEHPDAVGIMGIYAYNGPIALDVLEEQGLHDAYRVVAFDLDPATLEGLADGTVDAAIGQRPYWFGYLSVYVLFAMRQLGVEEALDVLAPWLSGEGGDIFDTGQDVVTPDTLPLYEEYLRSLNITSS